MSGAVISRVQLGAAHDGVAEMVVTLRYENGGETLVALDAYAADHLMTACSAPAPESLVGQGWAHVRDALEASSNRFLRAETQDSETTDPRTALQGKETRHV